MAISPLVKSTRGNVAMQSATTTAFRGARLLLFELDVRGHHPGYLQHLVQYWCQQELGGQLDIVVSNQFVVQHQQIVELAATAPQGNVRFVAITMAEERDLFDPAALESSFKGRIQRAFQEWRLLRKYTKLLKTDHCFVMYLDTLLLRLSLLPKLPFGLKSLPCAMSAIYFRPILHYGNFPSYVPEGRESVWYWRDRICLSRLLRVPNLNTLFCLDGFAAEHINQVYGTNQAVHLADPVQIYPVSPTAVSELRQRLGVDPQRQVFLLFGALSERKGWQQVLDALTHLPADLCQQISLLFIGPIAAPEKAILQQQIAALTAALPIQIITEHQFIPDTAIQPYFHLADVILAPYQRHIGMSAILVRAAAAEKPVIASDFGLMGEVTRRYGLGLAIEASHPAQIAAGMQRCLWEGADQVGDRLGMRAFAAQNTAKRFASQIFQCLQAPPDLPAQLPRSRS
jgi:glycosyltransferase involved in cell wall biosynthesis